MRDTVRSTKMPRLVASSTPPPKNGATREPSVALNVVPAVKRSTVAKPNARTATAGGRVADGAGDDDWAATGTIEQVVRAAANRSLTSRALAPAVCRELRQGRNRRGCHDRCRRDLSRNARAPPQSRQGW